MHGTSLKPVQISSSNSPLSLQAYILHPLLSYLLSSLHLRSIIRTIPVNNSQIKHIACLLAFQFSLLKAIPYLEGYSESLSQSLKVVLFKLPFSIPRHLTFYFSSRPLRVFPYRLYTIHIYNDTIGSIFINRDSFKYISGFPSSFHLLSKPSFLIFPLLFLCFFLSLYLSVCLCHLLFDAWNVTSKHIFDFNCKRWILFCSRKLLRPSIYC